MRFVYAQLKGGLGNQLFIYAFAKSISISSNRKLILDIYSGFEADTKYNRKYELNKFDISAYKIINNSSTLYSKKFLKKLSILCNKFIPKKFKFYIFESNLIHNSKLGERDSKHTHLYIDGYWQSEKYFKNHSEDIFDDFKSFLNDKNDLNKITSLMNENSVSVHVRKFVDHSSKLNNNLDLKYYKEAFKIIENKINQPIYYIFSEPGAIKEEIRNFFISKNCVFICDLYKNLTSDIDFFLMAKCRHHVIANSTFSWWSAWIGEKSVSKSIVIAPKIFIDDGPASWGFEGQIPDRWHKC